MLMLIKYKGVQIALFECKIPQLPPCWHVAIMNTWMKTNLWIAHLEYEPYCCHFLWRVPIVYTRKRIHLSFNILNQPCWILNTALYWWVESVKRLSKSKQSDKRLFYQSQWKVTLSDDDLLINRTCWYFEMTVFEDALTRRLMTLKSLRRPWPTNLTLQSIRYLSLRYVAFRVVRCLEEMVASRSPGLMPENLVR